MKFSKFLNKSFSNEEDFYREQDEKIDKLFEESIKNYNILKTTIVVDDKEEEVYITTDLNCLDDFTIEESVKNEDYDYCYKCALYKLEQFIYETLYEFTENINENWDDLEEV